MRNSSFAAISNNMFAFFGELNYNLISTIKDIVSSHVYLQTTCTTTSLSIITFVNIAVFFAISLYWWRSAYFITCEICKCVCFYNKKCIAYFTADLHNRKMHKYCINADTDADLFFRFLPTFCLFFIESTFFFQGL